MLECMRALVRVCVRMCMSMYYAYINACVCVRKHSCVYACFLCASLSVYVCMCFVWDYVCDRARLSSSLFTALNEFADPSRVHVCDMEPNVFEHVGHMVAW